MTPTTEAVRAAAGIRPSVTRPGPVAGALGLLLVASLSFAGDPVRSGPGSPGRSPSARQVTGLGEVLQEAVAGHFGATFEFRLTPVAAHPDGPYNTGGAYDDSDIVGQTLYVPAGGFISYWNIQLVDWDPGFVGPEPNDGREDLELAIWQARVDSTGYATGTGVPLTEPVVPCVISADCLAPTGFGEPGANCDDGFCVHAWINKARGGVCNAETFSCSGGLHAGALCATNRDCGDGFRRFDPFSCSEPVWDTVPDSLGDGPLFFGANDPEQPGSGFFCGMRDPHIPVYGGTLALHVPADAAGVYTIPFSPPETFGYRWGAWLPYPSVVVPGQLVVAAGACCDRFTSPVATCTDGLTSVRCDCPGCEWFEGAACDEVECTAILGACCNRTSTHIADCADAVPPIDCDCPNCVWVQDTTCEELGCFSTIGACCDHGSEDVTVSSCTETTIDACTCEKCIWTADLGCEQVACDPNFITIPTVSEWGLVVMTLLLLTLGKVYFGRSDRRPVCLSRS